LKHLTPGVIALIVAVIFLLFWAALVVTADDEVLWSRTALAGIFTVIVGLRLIDSFLAQQGKVKPWSELAARVGLTCRTSRYWLGYPVHVVGTYRGHGLTLYANDRGRLQAPTTRIELNIKNRAGAAMRLHGPYPNDEVVLDPSLGKFFAVRDYRIGDRHFFVKSTPESLAVSLFAAGDPQVQTLHEQLVRLQRDVNLEVDGSKLFFDQIGVLEDVEYLQFLFDLLSNLADVIEQASGWLRS
jgi:hypothetical protein